MARRDVAIEIIAPVKGINVALGSSMISLEETPGVQNCDAYYGAVQKDYGLTLFNTGTSSGTALGVIGAPINYIYPANFGDNTTLQVFSHTNMYKYQGGVDDNFEVDTNTTYTGSFGDYWVACIHNESMIYVNGIDLVQAKLSAATTGAVMGGVATDSYKAWSVQSFKEHLNLYHTEEGGVECPKRVRWTMAGLLGYTSTDWTAGTAGFLDIQDVEGEIKQTEKLGNGAVAIYGDGSIHLQQWVGGTEVYRFTQMLKGINIPSRRAVVSNDNIHYIAARDNIYTYQGGTTLTPIGDKIKSEYIAEVNQNAADLTFCQFIKEDGELRVYVPTGTSTAIDTCYICKVNDGGAWFKASRPYTACGQFTRQSSIRIVDLGGDDGLVTIGALTKRIGEYGGAQGSNVYVLGDTTGRVVKMDKNVFSVSVGGAALAQDFSFDTKDITSYQDVDPLIKNRYEIAEYMDNQTRWLAVKAELKGYGTVGLHYSTDNGQVWTECDESPLTLDATWKMYTCDVDRSRERIRYRFTNTATNEAVYLRYVKVEFVPGAETQWG